MIKKISKLVVLMLVVIAFSLSFCCAKNAAIPPEVQRELEIMRATEGIIELYGRVVDQYGKPVEGATVTLSVTQVSWRPQAPLEFQVETDSAGCFMFDPKKKTKGYRLFVRNIEKDGYEISFQEDLRGFDYRTNNPHRFIADKANPIVYHIRKMGEVAFCMNLNTWECQIKVMESSLTKGYDFIKRTRIDNMAKPFRNGEKCYGDVTVKATLDSTGTTWTVVLSTEDSNGGILVSDQLLYEAPETGYQMEFTFTHEDQKPVKTIYVYLKSRNPAIYTRIEIKNIVVGETFLRLRGTSVTNPYGDRNLEPADLSGKLQIQLEDEIRAAFRKGQRPARPDSKMLKDAQAKYRADKAAEERRSNSPLILMLSKMKAGR